ncbi:MAG: ABC transporter substrate-binding protein, partial [Alkalispirochaetaceae bacterium]
MFVVATVFTLVAVSCDTSPFVVAVLNPSNHGDRIVRLVEREIATGNPDREVVLHYEGQTRDAAELARLAEGYREDEVDAFLVMTQFAVDIAVDSRDESPIPIVAWTMDPPEAVGVDLDSGLSDRGITGVFPGFAMTPAEEKRLEWLERLAPDTSTVYVPYNPRDVDLVQGLDAFETTAEALGLTLLLEQIRTPEDAARSAAAIPNEADAVFLFGDRNIGTARKAYYANAVERGLPLAAPNAASVQEGALFSYSFSDASVASILANSINALASGREVETIPFQVPDFELSINLDTA